jgi:hypothetical protein
VEKIDENERMIQSSASTDFLEYEYFEYFAQL